MRPHILCVNKKEAIEKGVLRGAFVLNIVPVMKQDLNKERM